MIYEYPDGNTIVIKEKRSLGAVLIMLLPLVIFVWFASAFFPGLLQGWGETNAGFREAIGDVIGRITNAFNGDFSLIALFPLFIYLYFALLFIRMVAGFVWLLIPRRTKIDGANNKISLPIRGTIYFEKVESVYTRHIHTDEDAESMVMVGLRLTDGTKHFFGASSDEAETQKVAEAIALLMGKANEVRS